MEMIHMDTKFKNVSETLLITLNARGKDADSPNSVLNDKKSAEIMSKIDYDFSKFDKGWMSYYGILARAKTMDQEIKKFMDKYPDCVIDSSWTEDVEINGKELLIISEGVLMYFDENEVKNFLNILTDRFDKFTLYLDLLSKKLVKQAKRHDTLKTMKNAEFKWGVKDGSEVVKLNPKIKQTGLINFTDELKHLLHGFKKLFIPIAYIMNNRLGMYEYKK